MISPKAGDKVIVDSKTHWATGQTGIVAVAGTLFSKVIFSSCQGQSEISNKFLRKIT